MSAHMKMRHTEPCSYCEHSKKKRRIPWRDSAKAEFEKYTEVGALIRGGRLKAGLTQKELAKVIGILPHHISEMEHGKRTIGKEMAKRLSVIFDVDYRIFL